MRGLTFTSAPWLQLPAHTEKNRLSYKSPSSIFEIRLRARLSASWRVQQRGEFTAQGTFLHHPGTKAAGEEEAGHICKVVTELLSRSTTEFTTEARQCSQAPQRAQALLRLFGWTPTRCSKNHNHLSNVYIPGSLHSTQLQSFPARAFHFAHDRRKSQQST